MSTVLPYIDIKRAVREAVEEFLKKLDVALSTRASESTLSSVLDAVRGRQPREIVLDDGSGVYDKIFRSGNALLISINEDKVGLAKETTLSGIKSQIDKLTFDADNYLFVNVIKIVNPPNLDVALSTRAPKDEGETIEICRDADISGGVEAPLRNFKRWTLYLKVGGAIDIKVELSPDDGNTWFEIPESPISFSSAGDNVIEFGYDATRIRLTGSNTNTVTAIVRGIF